LKVRIGITALGVEDFLVWFEENKNTHLKLSIILAFETPKSRIIVFSSMLTTAENITAKTIVCTELGGSMPRETSSQKLSYSLSNVGR
jgi:hypothetical protein